MDIVAAIIAVAFFCSLLVAAPFEWFQPANRIAAKAQTDFWLNLWLLGGLPAAYVWGGWFPVLFALIVFIAASRAKTAAIHWGDYVKACFDLFLPALREKLQLPVPADIDDERALWTRFSRVVIYHEQDLVMSRIPPPAVDKREEMAGSERKLQEVNND